MGEHRCIWLLACAALWPGASALSQVTQEQSFGRFLLDVDGLRRPMGLAVGPDGLVRVSETDADRIGVFGLDGAAAGPAFGDPTAAVLAPHGLAFGDNGLLYVADTGNHRVLALDNAGSTQHAWGGFGIEEGRFNRPQALAVAGDRVYVADTGNDRIQVFDAAGRLLSVFGGRGREPGQFMRPLGVAVDGQGNIFIADADNHRVQKLDPDGRPLHAWGGWGSFPGLFMEPSALTFGDDVLYVAGRLNHRVQAFDAEGDFLYQWGLHAVVPRAGDGKIHYPNGLVMAPDGDALVVAEAFENRCQLFGRLGPEPESGAKLARPKRSKYSHFGTLLAVDGELLAVSEPETRSVAVFHLSREEPILITKVGEYGTRFGQFGRITAVHLDTARGALYVADAGNDRLQVFRLNLGPDWRLRFDPSLAPFVRAVGLDRLGRAVEPLNPEARLEPVAMATDTAGNLFLLDGHGLRVVMLDQDWNVVRSWSGVGDGRFVNPVDIEIDPDGDRLYVADAWERRVHVFELDGTFVTSLGPGTGSEALVRPAGVAVDAEGFLYITDSAIDRVVKLDPSGQVVAAWGTPGIEHGEFWKPHGIAQDERGRIIVLDYGNHRAQIFSTEGTWQVTFSAAASYTPQRPGRKSPQ